MFVRQIVDTAITEETDITVVSDANCGGVYFGSNSFTGSYSCGAYGGGVLTYECVSPNDSISGTDETTISDYKTLSTDPSYSAGTMLDFDFSLDTYTASDGTEVPMYRTEFRSNSF
jgi:hypothetical protein